MGMWLVENLVQKDRVCVYWVGMASNEPSTASEELEYSESTENKSENKSEGESKKDKSGKKEKKEKNGKKEKGLVGSLYSSTSKKLKSFRSIKEEDFLSLVSKDTRAELAEKFKLKKTSKSNSSVNNLMHAKTSSKFDESLSILKRNKKKRKENSKDEDELKNENAKDDESVEISFGEVISEPDSFLDESPAVSPRKTSGSKPNSKEDLAAERRAKFLQRYTMSAIIDEENSSSENVKDPHMEMTAGSFVNKQFHKRFPDLVEEMVIDDFLCALLLRGTLLAQGSMYITSNYVAFYANIFGSKTRVAIKFLDILCIRKCKILKSIPNSIEIHTLTKKYFWASYLHRERCYQLLDSRWRYFRHKIGAPVFDEDSLPSVDDDSVRDSDFGFDWQEDQNLKNLDSPLSSPPGSSLESVSIFSTGKKECLDVNLPNAQNCCHKVVMPNTIPPLYTEKFPISLNEFYLNFISDRSEQFWREFHSRDGYDNFRISSWQKTAEECCFERHTEFRAPIKMSLAPKFTRVIQQQKFRFLSENALIFETSSHSRDVPYSNQFLVESVWIINSIDENQCELSIYLTVKFIKTNWLKSMIEKNALDGSKEWFENWIKSALAVSRFIQQNSSIPKSQRTSKSEILRQSMVHFPRVENEEEKKDIEQPQEPVQPKVGLFGKVLDVISLIQTSKFLKLLFIFTLITLFSLILLNVYFYFNTTSLQSTLNEEKNEYLTLCDNLLYARSLSTVNSEQNLASIPSLSSCINDNPDKFTAIEKDFKLHFEQWRESTSDAGKS